MLTALLANEEYLATNDDVTIPDLSKLNLNVLKHTAQIIIPTDLIATQGTVSY